MKYIKPINEWKSPAYTRGEVTIFTKRSSDVDFDFAQKIAKLLGYEVKEQVYDNAYVVLCEPGKEEQCGSAFVEDYPEFFESYEREDVRSTKLTDIGDDIKERVQDLMDDYTGRTGPKSTINTNKWNGEIDEIIKMLTDIKIQ